ncbi:MAG: hypothetical protein RIC56_23125 [Pseudomonadales bacterium]
MTPYGWAWLIVVATVPVGLFALQRLFRGTNLPRSKRTAALLIAVWLLLPAPVPGHAGHLAPAFLVLAFEWLFQRPGQPQTAGLILAAGTVAALGVALLAVSLGRRGARRRG